MSTPYKFSYHLYSHSFTLSLFFPQVWMCLCMCVDIYYSSPFSKFICLLDSAISVTHGYFKFSIHTTHLSLPNLLFSFSSWLRHHNQLSFPIQKHGRHTTLLLPLTSIQSPSPITFTSSASLESALCISRAWV